jgi:allantoinase
MENKASTYTRKPSSPNSISRRQFLDRTSKAALGGLGAATLFERGAYGAVPTQAMLSTATPSATSTLPPNRFDYSPIIDRPVIKWPNNARVAFWVGPNIEWHEYTPQNHPTQPDIPSYAYYDAGNRVGFWRMLEVMDKHKIRGCVCLNDSMLYHCPEIRDAMVKRNWAYMAHGVYNSRPITDYSIEQEREYWRDTIATVKQYTGKQIKGRLGRGSGNTPNTPDLMAEFGLTYHCDWMFDDQPFPMKVNNGAKFIHVPYSFQLHDLQQSGWGKDAKHLAQAIKDQFDVYYAEGAESGKVMCVALHPYLIGKAHRAKYLDEAFSYVLSHDGVWNTTADEIADYYIANYYDKVVAYVEQQKQKGLA